ncbi:hypothetical protein GCM10023317_05920 [Actinopolymorpha pittospori]
MDQGADRDRDVDDAELLIAFIVYQLYRMVLAPTVGLAALTIFDAAIAWLTWREYRRGPVANQKRTGSIGSA